MTLKSSPSSLKDGMQDHTTQSPFYPSLHAFPSSSSTLGWPCWGKASQLRQAGGKNLSMTLPIGGQKLISSCQVGSWIPPRFGGLSMLGTVL